jgi:hypothetical protein
VLAKSIYFMGLKKKGLLLIVCELEGGVI